MIRIVSVSIILLLAIKLYSQQDISLNGSVVIQNSETETGKIVYVPNVLVSASKSIPQFSDKNGVFSLIFSDEEYGKNVVLDIEKSGYEVVNRIEINAASIVGSKVPVKVVLCTEGKLEQNQLMYNNLAKNFVAKQELSQLKNEMQEVGLFYEEEVSSLNNRLTEQEDFIQRLSAQWSIQNLDDKSPEYREAFEQIKLSDLDAGLELLKKIDFEERLEINSNSIKKVRKNKEIFELNEESLLRQQSNELLQLLERARIKILKRNITEAIEDLILGLRYEDDNLDFNLELAYAYQLDGNSKCIEYYSKIESLTSDTFTVSCAYNNIGVFYKDLNQSKNAEKYLIKSERLRKELYNNGQARGNYIHTLNSLGNLYSNSKIGTNELAIFYYEKAVEFGDNLNPKGVNRHNKITFGPLINHAGLCVDLSDFIKAEELFEEAYEIYKNQKDSIDLIERLAFLNNYGLFKGKYRDDLDASFKLLEVAVKDFESENPEIIELYSNPESYNKSQVHPVFASLYKNMGKVLSKSDWKHLGDSCFHKAMAVYKNLIGKNENGKIYINALLITILEYAQYCILNEEKKLALLNVKSVENSLLQLENNKKVKIDYGRIYRSIAQIYSLSELRDEALVYLEKEYLFFDNLFKKKPEIGYLDKLKSSVNYSTFYLLGSKKNDSIEGVIRDRLKGSIRNAKKFRKKDTYTIEIVGHAENLLEHFKKGIQFGENPKRVELDIKM